MWLQGGGLGSGGFALSLRWLVHACLLLAAAATAVTQGDDHDTRDLLEMTPGEAVARAVKARVMILKMERSGSSLLGYQLNALGNEVLCGMLGDSPHEDVIEKLGRERLWVKIGAFLDLRSDEFTVDEQVYEIERVLGYNECENEAWCEYRRKCEHGGVFQGVLWAHGAGGKREAREQKHEMERARVAQLSEHIRALPVEERPLIWVHTRRNFVRQAISAYKATYMEKHKEMCPGVSRYHLDPKKCPEALQPLVIPAADMEKLTVQRRDTAAQVKIYGATLAAAVAGVDAPQVGEWDPERGTGLPFNSIDCTMPEGCDRNGVPEGELSQMVTTTYEYVTEGMSNGAKALAELLGADEGWWPIFERTFEEPYSPKSSSHNTRDAVLNFDELLEHARQQPPGTDSPWRGEHGIAAMMCWGATDPPCPEDLLHEVTSNP